VVLASAHCRAGELTGNAGGAEALDGLPEFAGKGSAPVLRGSELPSQLAGAAYHPSEPPISGQPEHRLHRGGSGVKLAQPQVHDGQIHARHGDVRIRLVWYARLEQAKCLLQLVPGGLGASGIAEPHVRVARAAHLVGDGEGEDADVPRLVRVVKRLTGRGGELDRFLDAIPIAKAPAGTSL
jgi:hypothetical protein